MDIVKSCKSSGLYKNKSGTIVVLLYMYQIKYHGRKKQPISQPSIIILEID